MNYKSIASHIVALLAMGSIAFAVEVFPRQPNLNAAYNKLLGVVNQLDKSKLEGPQKHFDQALVDLESAKTLLDLCTNDKGTYLPTAKKLCDDAKAALTATPPDVDKANEIVNHALEELKRAGLAGRRRR